MPPDARFRGARGPEAQVSASPCTTRTSALVREVRELEGPRHGQGLARISRRGRDHPARNGRHQVARRAASRAGAELPLRPAHARNAAQKIRRARTSARTATTRRPARKTRRRRAPLGGEAARCSGSARKSRSATRRGSRSRKCRRISIAKPTLVWLVIEQTSRSKRVEVSYLAQSLNWSADYVLVVNEQDTQGDLVGWVTLAQPVGRQLQERGAASSWRGDVNRVRDQHDGPATEAHAPMSRARQRPAAASTSKVCSSTTCTRWAARRPCWKTSRSKSACSKRRASASTRS